MNVYSTVSIVFSAGVKTTCRRIIKSTRTSGIKSDIFYYYFFFYLAEIFLIMSEIWEGLQQSAVHGSASAAMYYCRMPAWLPHRHSGSPRSHICVCGTSFKQKDEINTGELSSARVFIPLCQLYFLVASCHISTPAASNSFKICKS